MLTAQRAVRAALEQVDVVASRRGAAIWILALALDGRADEASARLRSSSGPWESPRGPHPELSREVVEALVRFHAGERVAGGAVLERFTSSHGPLSNLAAFHSAALAHDEGRPELARDLLARIVASDRETFVARWARTPLETLGGPTVGVSEQEAARQTRRSGLPGQLVDGVRLLCFRGEVATRMASDPARIAALFLVDVALISIEIPFARSRVEPLDLSTYAMTVSALVALPLVLVVACVLVRPRRAEAPARLLALVYSMLPLLLLVHTAVRVELVGAVTPVEVLLGTWLAAALVVAQRHVFPRASWLRRSMVALPVVALLGTAGPLGARADELLASADPSFDPWASSTRPTDADRVMAGFRDSAYARNSQAIEEVVSLVHGEDALKPGTPGLEEMYFLGFAGWGRQDVFLNEVTSVRHRFDDRFGTEGRSLALINAPDGGVHAPATEATLRHALAAFGSRMNVDEDVLVLYLTSHGGRSGLSIARSGPPLDVVPWSTLSPAAVRAALDEAHVVWRVVIVAGCETGVFLDALQDDHTVVATAAARDRVSYGCGTGRAATEYGARFLSATSGREATLLGALEQSQDVSSDEIRRALVPSLPRLSIGRAIEAKLARMARK